MFKKLLCFLGLHRWEYNKYYTKRWCSCGVCQEQVFILGWRECIDGEPIDVNNLQIFVDNKKVYDAKEEKNV